MYIAMSFFRLGIFSSMILLKTFSGPLSWEYSPSIPITLRFGLLIMSQFSWIFCVWNFLDFSFYLTNVSFSLIVSFAPEILSSMFCILLVMLVSVVPVPYLVFHLQVCQCLSFLYFFCIHFQFLNSFIHFLYLFVFSCIPLYLFPL